MAYYAFQPVAPLPYTVKPLQHLFRKQKKMVQPKLPRFIRRKAEVPPDALLTIRFDPKKRIFTHLCPPANAVRSQRIYRKLGLWSARLKLMKALWGGWREMENVLCDHAYRHSQKSST